jgi:hypothetical protein
MDNAVEITIGTYESITFTIKENGSPKNVASFAITFSLGTGKETPIQKTNGSGIDMTNASSGVIVVELSAEDTASLFPIGYQYELRGSIDSKPEVWKTGGISVVKPFYL